MPNEKLLHLEDSHRTARFCLSLTAQSNGKKSLPFLHREFEIMDKSLQLWTELLNLSDTHSLPQGSFRQEQLSVYACGRKRFTGAAKGTNNFWCSVHIPSMVLAMPVHGCVWLQLLWCLAQLHRSRRAVQGSSFATSQNQPSIMDPRDAGLRAEVKSLPPRHPLLSQEPRRDSASRPWAISGSAVPFSSRTG